MKLEDLKKKATASEMGLINSVERLVRSEYDKDKIRKELHSEITKGINEEILKVLEHHNIFKQLTPSSHYYTSSDRDYMKGVIYEIGDAIRLKCESDA